MNINTTKSGNTRTMAVEGRIDTLTSPEFESEFNSNAADCDKMIFDLKDVDYISSAGLRAIVFAHREMEKKGGLVLRGLNKNIETIINMTGFNNVLNIEK